MTLEKQIVELREKGLSYRQIAKEIGCSVPVVQYWCKKNGTNGQINDGGVQKPFTEVIELIKSFGYEYINGYENVHSLITVCCSNGHDSQRWYHTFRDYQREGKEIKCAECMRLEAKAKRDSIKASKDAEREERIKAIESEKQLQLIRTQNQLIIKRMANHVCKNCGVEYCVAVTGYDSELYCSLRCSNRWHERLKNDIRLKRIKNRPHDDDITLEKLFKRDNGICYLCGSVCSWEDAVMTGTGTFIAGDNYPSIEHVKPISKGGTHTWSNVKLACRKCNSLKGWR